MKPLRILLLEDSPDDAFLIERELERAEMVFELHRTDNGPDFEQALATFDASVILCDHSLPAFNSIEAFAMYKVRQKQTGISIPFILVTGHVSEEFAIQTIKAGVDDYIIKDRLKRLPMAIEGALEKCRIENERSRYLRQVIAKEALMNEAEQVAGFGSWEVDAATGKYTWSDSMYAIYGFTPEAIEPNYETFINSVHPDDRERLLKELGVTLERLSDGDYEFRIVTPAGAVKHISCRMQIQRDSRGAPLRFVGVNVDITERKEAEVLIARTTQEYKSLFHQNPDAVYSFDLSGTFTDVNDALAAIAGLPRHELRGKHFSEFVHPEDLRFVNEKFSAAVEGKAQRYETRLVTASGETLTFDITNIPIIMNGEVLGVYGVGKDITEARRQNLEIAEQNTTLREIAWMQSHKIRAPLARIMGLVHLLKNDNCGPMELPRILADIEFCAEELDAVVKGIVRKTEESTC